MNTVEPDIRECRTLMISSLTYECLNRVPQCKYSLCVGLACFCMHPYKSEFSKQRTVSFSLREH
jgi:hypothetical protein